MKTSLEISTELIKRRDEYYKRKKRQGIVALFMVPLFVLGLLGVYHLTQREIAPALKENVIVVNETEELLDAPPKLNGIALMYDDFIKMNEEELATYYKTDVFPKVPEDLKKWEESYGIFKRKNGEIYYDGNIINYSNEDFSRKVNLAIAKETNLPYDVLVMSKKEEVSIINAQKVVIAKDPDNNYMVCFKYNDVGFTLMTHGLQLDEIESMVASLIS